VLKLRDIVVRSTSSNGAVDSGTALAILLAQSHEALLTALVYEVDVVSDLEDETDQDRLRAKKEAIRRDAAITAEVVRTAAEQAGVEHDVIVERPSVFGVGEVLADYARVRDLAVVGVTGVLGGQARLLAETLLFGSGRPLILAPEGATPVAAKRIAIAWDANPAVVHAITGALPLLKAAQEVLVITVTDDKEFRRGQSGIELCRHLERHGIESSFNPVERRDRDVTEMLLEAAAADAADMLVMGGYAHSTLRGLIFGSATRGLFKRPIPLPILMAH
jgi:nucleotide-binding universal stress UspA family protein